MQKSTLVVTIRDRQLANKILQTGLYFGGRRHIVEKYWEAGRGEICPRCCKFGHYGGCMDEIRCYLCAGPHIAGEHICPVEGCNMKAPCKHVPPKCANCLGRHCATSVKCPKKWENIKPKKGEESQGRQAQPRQSGLPERPKTPEILNRPSTPKNVQLSPQRTEAMEVDNLSLPTTISSVFISPSSISSTSVSLPVTLILRLENASGTSIA